MTWISSLVMGEFQDVIVMDRLRKEFFESFPAGTPIGEP